MDRSSSSRLNEYSRWSPILTIWNSELLMNASGRWDVNCAEISRTDDWLKLTPLPQKRARELCKQFAASRLHVDCCSNPLWLSLLGARCVQTNLQSPPARGEDFRDEEKVSRFQVQFPLATSSLIESFRRAPNAQHENRFERARSRGHFLCNLRLRWSPSVINCRVSWLIVITRRSLSL